MTLLQRSIKGSGSAEIVKCTHWKKSRQLITYDPVLQGTWELSRSVPRRRRRWDTPSSPSVLCEQLPRTGPQLRTTKFPRPYQSPLQQRDKSMNRKFKAALWLTKEFVGNNEGFVWAESFRICFTGLILTVVIYFIPAQVPTPGVLIVSNQGLQMRMLLLSKSPGISPGSRRSGGGRPVWPRPPRRVSPAAWWTRRARTRAGLSRNPPGHGAWECVLLRTFFLFIN